jgi:phosphoribosylformimino-5-aminoimidazole carboxamide ribotide isomerase
VDIYGVLDLQAGHVVRGIGGLRESYRPITGRLTRSSAPRDVAMAMVEQLGIRLIYVADLDAIAGREPDFREWESIARSGARLLVDAGAGDWRRAEPIVSFQAATGCLDGIVVPLESVTEPCQLADTASRIGPRESVFSLDLNAGRPVTPIASWGAMTAMQMAELAWAAGFRRLLVLDLASVGRSQGPATLDLCRQARARHAWNQLLSGGGVRGRADLRALARAGCDAALVASALHDGAIGPDDL